MATTNCVRVYLHGARKALIVLGDVSRLLLHRHLLQFYLAFEQLQLVFLHFGLCYFGLAEFLTLKVLPLLLNYLLGLRLLTDCGVARPHNASCDSGARGVSTVDPSVNDFGLLLLL